MKKTVHQNEAYFWGNFIKKQLNRPLRLRPKDRQGWNYCIPLGKRNAMQPACRQ
jgi:hypothetical protein